MKFRCLSFLLAAFDHMSIVAAQFGLEVYFPFRLQRILATN